MRRIGPRARVVAMVLLFASCAAARPAAAQTMSYSAYSDMYSDDDNNWTIMGYGDLEDWGGCVSGSPTPNFMELYSPSRYATGGSSVSMPFDAENGDWTVVSHFSFTCNCAPYGGSHTFTIGDGTTDTFWAYAARYKYADSGNCVAGFARYTAHQCSHECQQEEKCLPRVFGHPEYYSVIGVRRQTETGASCSPGVPYPYEDLNSTLCYHLWP